MTDDEVELIVAEALASLSPNELVGGTWPSFTCIILGESVEFLGPSTALAYGNYWNASRLTGYEGCKTLESAIRKYVLGLNYHRGYGLVDSQL